MLVYNHPLADTVHNLEPLLALGMSGHDHKEVPHILAPVITIHGGWTLRGRIFHVCLSVSLEFAQYSALRIHMDY